MQHLDPTIAAPPGRNQQLYQQLIQGPDTRFAPPMGGGQMPMQQMTNMPWQGQPGQLGRQLGQGQLTPEMLALRQQQGQMGGDPASLAAFGGGMPQQPMGGGQLPLPGGGQGSLSDLVRMQQQGWRGSPGAYTAPGQPPGTPPPGQNIPFPGDVYGQTPPGVPTPGMQQLQGLSPQQQQLLQQSAFAGTQGLGDILGAQQQGNIQRFGGLMGMISGNLQANYDDALRKANEMAVAQGMTGPGGSSMEAANTAIAGRDMLRQLSGLGSQAIGEMGAMQSAGQGQMGAAGREAGGRLSQFQFQAPYQERQYQADLQNQMFGQGIQRGQLGLGQAGQALQERLGIGGERLGWGQLAEQGRQRELQGELGRGGLAEQAAGRQQAGELGRGSLAEQAAGRQQAGELGRGSLAEQAAGRQQAGELSREQMAQQGRLAQNQLDIQERLGMGQERLRGVELDIQRNLGEADVALRRDLGFANIGLGRDELDLMRDRFDNDSRMQQAALDFEQHREEFSQALQLRQQGMSEEQIRYQMGLSDRQFQMGLFIAETEQRRATVDTDRYGNPNNDQLNDHRRWVQDRMDGLERRGAFG